VRYLGVDLLEASAVAKALQGVPKATHVFFSARAKFGEGGVENVEDNVAMLRNVLDATGQVSGLAHVHRGGKWCQHLGAYLRPPRRTTERHIPPISTPTRKICCAAAGEAWSWSASPRNVICDFAPERAQHHIIVGAYAAVYRNLACGSTFLAIRISSAR
jgi:hypothetical protein